jgi:NACalpha-BTF3-like transcription factor|tara:strand:- start:1427 stop:2023 length:597 start_codon:yes stop_codon:yes gene_type:complete
MTGSERDEWADDMFAEMARMFEQMGMSIDIKALEAMMNQIREQFEQMGIDPTKLSHSQIKVDTNTEPEEFRRIMESMLNGPDGISELLKNMGVNIQVNGPGEAEAEAEETEESDVSDLPEEDIYVHDGRMSVTIDISRFLDIRPEDVELVLSSGGEVLQLMKKTQPRPFKRFILPEAAGQIVEWELNNGILDIKLDLV